MDITDGQRAVYQQDGVIFLPAVFDLEWIELLAAGIKRNLEDPTLRYKDLSAREASGRYLTGMWNWFHIPEFKEFAYHSPAGPIAAQLMLSKLAIFLEDNWFVKEPGAVGRTPWHQDEPYYHTLGPFCSVWLPLDPVDPENGIEFIRGSHRWGKLFMPTNFEDLSARDCPREVGGIMYELLPDIDASRASYDIVSWHLEPGDCLVFDARTVHGAPGNSQDRNISRRMSTRWAHERTVYFDKEYSWTSFVSDHGLRTGDLLRGDKFPVVWRGPEPEGLTGGESVLQLQGPE